VQRVVFNCGDDRFELPLVEPFDWHGDCERGDGVLDVLGEVATACAAAWAAARVAAAADATCCCCCCCCC